MRVLAFAACVVTLFCSTGAALAADCTKGMLWPYVRNPGDCLTDEEIRTGRLGASNGPVSLVPGDNAIKPATATAPAAGAAPTASVAAPAANAAAATPVSATPAVASAPANAACNKGWLWPFVRDSGDCLTDTEKKEGETGVYGNSGATATATASSTATCSKGWWPFGSDCSQPATISMAPANAYSTPPTPASYTAMPAANANAAPAPQTASLPAACHKGILWPFSREPGDCLTDTEKKEGETGVYGNSGGASAAPAAASTATATCSKGWWPFGSSDCDQPAMISMAPQSANSAAATPASYSPMPAAAANVPASGSCTKGWLWPFVRDAGDCLTDTEKKNGQTGAYGGGAGAMPASQVTMSNGAMPPMNATPAAMTTQADSAPMAATGSSEACHKGIFWPFYRDVGDCLTDTEKKAGKTGVYTGQ